MEYNSNYITGDHKLSFDWLDFTNQGHKFWSFIGQSYIKSQTSQLSYTYESLKSLIVHIK